MDIIEKILENPTEIMTTVLAVVGAASAVAALTPTPKDDKIISTILKVIRKIANVFGLNVGNAKNLKD